MIPPHVSTRCNHRARGQVLIMIAALAALLIGLGGLAVDLVLVYSAKTYLATATDSAALGGIRALDRGVSYSDQESEIQRTVSMLFDANFADGFLLIGSVGKPSQQVKVAARDMDPKAPSMFESDPTLKEGLREIRVTTEAQAPTLFMRIFGVGSVTVKSGAYAARRDVNVMVVIDRSSSLETVGAWGDVQRAAIAFIEQFDNNRDRVGVVTFDSGARLDVPLATGFKTDDSAKNAILSQAVPTGAAANGSRGMWLAYSELLRVSDPDAVNAIVFFTNGPLSAFSGNFRAPKTPARPASPSCGGSLEDAVIAATQDKTVQSAPKHDGVVSLWTMESGSAAGRGLELGSGCDVSSIGWPADWLANEGGAPAKRFCIQPGASGCAGDAGDFPYSVDDPRLFQDNGDASDAVFRWTNVHNGSKNLVLNIAQTARRDASLGGVHIHAIGLGGSGDGSDAALMKRIANDPSDNYGARIAVAPNEPKGSYTYSPSVRELEEAFNRVRGEVVRLTR